MGTPALPANNENDVRVESDMDREAIMQSFRRTLELFSNMENICQHFQSLLGQLSTNEGVMQETLAQHVDSLKFIDLKLRIVGAKLETLNSQLETVLKALLDLNAQLDLIVKSVLGFEMGIQQLKVRQSQDIKRVYMTISACCVVGYILIKWSK